MIIDDIIRYLDDEIDKIKDDEGKKYYHAGMMCILQKIKIKMNMEFKDQMRNEFLSFGDHKYELGYRDGKEFGEVNLRMEFLQKEKENRENIYKQGYEDGRSMKGMLNDMDELKRLLKEGLDGN